MAMFTTLFLGSVLAVFLTLGIVRGDAESGLLQPLVVRPIGRTTLLLSRFLAAAGLAAAYVLAVYAGRAGDHLADRALGARPPARARRWPWPSRSRSSPRSRCSPRPSSR